MYDISDTEVLARVAASPGRRFLGIGMLSFLGVLVIYVALFSPPSTLWQIFLIVLGATALFFADAMRRSTAFVLELTKQELRDSSGEVLVRLDDVASIDKGTFAFKPSNGFLLRTKIAAPRMWRPGLWWRIGRRIGVGGMTPGRQTKYMSEIIATILAERDGL
jgi:hypothetical protein